MKSALNNRDTATILHGLRLIQERANGFGDCSYANCDHFAEVDELTNEEIDALCERLNVGDEADWNEQEKKEEAKA